MQELRRIAEREHYMDLSEAVRSFLRKKMLENSNKKSSDASEIRDQLSRILEKKISEENKKLLISN
jgi:metal-responsive CopG/Arc/MetJ family transcriptional regulator